MGRGILEFSKGRQCEHQAETDLEGDIIIDGAAEIDALDIALYPFDGDHIVSLSSRDLSTIPICVSYDSLLELGLPNSRRHA